MKTSSEDSLRLPVIGSLLIILQFHFKEKNMDIEKIVDELMTTRATRVFKAPSEDEINLIVDIAMGSLPVDDDMLQELSFGDVILGYGECIHSSLSDSKYGEYKQDRFTLPLGAFIVDLLDSEKKRYAMQCFMNLNYLELTNYILNNRLIPSYQRSLMKRCLERFRVSKNNTVSQTIRLYRKQAQAAWRPSDDLGEYVSQIRTAHTKMLILIFYPLYYLAGMKPEYATHASELQLDLNELLCSLDKPQTKYRCHMKKL